jgi:hypothetical protein
MSRRKEYDFDPKQAEINKKEIEKRRGEKWKELELLKELKEREEYEKDLFGTLISEYTTILKNTKDEDVASLAKRGIKNASENYRKALRARFSREVQWAPPAKFTQAPVMEGRIPFSTDTYTRMKEDIERKGITDPILVTDSYEIIDGFNRWKIAKEIELDKVPYMMVNLKTIPANLKQRLIFDLGLGNNLNRRQLSMEDKKKLIDQWLTFHRKKPFPGRPTNKEVEIATEWGEKGLEGMPELHRHIAHSFGLTPITRKNLAEHLGVGKRTIERVATKIYRLQAETVNPVNPEPIIETHVFSNTFGRSNDRDRIFSREIKEWIDNLIKAHDIKKTDNLRLDIRCTIKRGNNETL